MTSTGLGDQAETLADEFVLALVAQGVDYLFLNPGTDTAPIQESLLTLARAGLSVPRVAMCPHESVALAAAHGYFARSGRPQVVMVHVDVGTQNLGSMLHNAFRADAGVVIVAGRTPSTEHGEQPGGRDTVVHWMQDVSDQTGIVRGYVKWSADLSGPTLGRQVARAFQVATSPSPGPVYLTVERELLMQPSIGSVSAVPVRRFAPPAPAAPNPGALTHAAEVLAGSAAPVIVTSRAGQNPESVPVLVTLAEMLRAPVIDGRERMNFPSEHPYYLKDAGAVQEALSGADVVLVVDAPIPWVPQVLRPPESATVISIDLDPVHASMPAWSLPVDIGLQCDPVLGLGGLVTCLEEKSRRPERKGHGEGRMGAISSNEPRGAAATETPPGHAMPPEAVAAAIDQVLREDDVVVEEATTNVEVMRTGITRTRPGTYYRSGGSGLGWGLGAALGVKLADPARRVVSVMGDGSFLFSSPASALWALREVGAPVLVIVLANGGYAASRRPVFDLYPQGSSAATGQVVGTLFGDSPDFAMLAQACDARGEHVRDATQLLPALQRGFEEVAKGSVAVVVAHVSSPWI